MANSKNVTYAEEDDYNNEGMPDIDEISPVLTGQNAPAHIEGQSATEIYNQLQRLPNRRVPSPINATTSTADYSQGYDPDDDPQFKVCNPLNCHDMTVFYNLAQIIKEEEDIMSIKLLNAMKDASEINTLDKTKLITEFKIFTRSALLDWTIIKRIIESACFQGYNSLFHTLLGMNAVYQLQHAKAMSANIGVLGTLVDQFKLHSTNLRKQNEMDRTFQEDLTRQINSLTKGIAEFSEKLESKTLEMSRPCYRKTTTSTTSPTVDSLSSHQTFIPGKISLIPQSIFQSEFLKVTIGINGDLTVLPVCNRAKPLMALIELKISKQGLMGILNQDLSLLLSQLLSYPSFVTNFNALTEKIDKITLLKQTFGNIPDRGDQWVHSPIIS